MKYNEFQIIFAKLEKGDNITEISLDHEINPRTLQRWKNAGFKVMREKKYYYCEICDVYTEIKHVHAKNYTNVTKKDKKRAIITKYNKKLKKVFENA